MTDIKNMQGGKMTDIVTISYQHGKYEVYDHVNNVTVYCKNRKEVEEIVSYIIDRWWERETKESAD